MRNKAITVPNVNTPNEDYPFGRIRNNEGGNNGTPIIEELYGDIHEFITGILTKAGISPNGLPENVTNGYQTLDALGVLPRKLVALKKSPEKTYFEVEAYLDRMKNGDYILLRTLPETFNPNQITVSDGVGKIMGLDEIERNCNFQSLTPQGSFFDQQMVVQQTYILECRSDSGSSFLVYPVLSRSIWTNVNGMINGLLGRVSDLESNSIVALHKGTASGTTIGSGTINVPHPEVDLLNTKIMYTLKFDQNGSPSGISDLGSALTNRSSTDFTIAYWGFTPNDTQLRPTIEWFIVKS